jgi:hypothetical protein
MAHPCYLCGTECYCKGDLDDIIVGHTPAHCESCGCESDDDDDLDPDLYFEDFDGSYEEWKKFFDPDDDDEDQDEMDEDNDGGFTVENQLVLDFINRVNNAVTDEDDAP